MSLHTRWINLHADAIDWRAAEHPAPLLRRSFNLENLPQQAIIRFASPGWADISVNGHAATADLMVPAVTQLDKHTGFCEYDVTTLLKPGKNVIGAILGNGWFNAATHETWHFDKAPWRNFNRLFLELYADGEKILVSDGNWKGCNGPIIFNQLRSGEHFDASLDIPGWNTPDFDDSTWKTVFTVTPPPGTLIRDNSPQCRITEILKPVKSHKIGDDCTVYDFGKNISGFCRVKVSGTAGSYIRIFYSELLAPSGELHRSNIDCYIINGDIAQMDKFILGTDSPAEWQPRFVYHGFRYVNVINSGDITDIEIEACCIRNAFDANGKYSISNDIAAKLLECTRNSYIANFTGIPTDCPHREKNGWTGDTQLACETGFWLYDGAANYEHFTQILADAQRPTGQLPGIVPTPGWGYNWGNGPVWDAALFELPLQIWRFTGNPEPAKKFYPNMKRYLRYALDMKNPDGTVDFGLGDWCHHSARRMVASSLTATSHLYHLLGIAEKIAELISPEEAAISAAERKELKNAFIRKFRNADGTYAKDEMTANASALYFGLDDSPALAAHLVQQVRDNNHKTDFGIVGAKAAPRVLAEYGYAADAFKLYTQTEFPGWGNWIVRGATTLWEQWNGSGSQTHIMFGDFAAWCFIYLAGIKILEPGFKKIAIAPANVPEAGDFTFSYRTPFGEITVCRTGGKFTCSVPEDIICTVTLP
ncbi:MAG: hypothetical protein E7057_10275 [Lentisphaerae bacterium]|nr:hypothetical protein [Lentisphaerota bacterium]